MNGQVSGSPNSGRAVFLLVTVVAGLITYVNFSPFIGNFFTYDDFGAIEHVQTGLRSVLLGYNYILRVVANAVWIPLYHFSGLDPSGYNLFSFALHFLNSLLVYLLVLRLFADRTTAALTALLFVATAVGADAIFWRAANSTPLNLFFYLLTLTGYLQYRSSGRRRYYVLSLLLFLLAVLSKEESASIPFVVALYDFLFCGGIRDWRGTIKRIIPYCALILVNLLVNYIIIYQVLQVSSELVKHSSFRPLHSLFSGFTVFFLQPDGRLKLSDPRIYAAAVIIPALFIWVKDKRRLAFGLGLVFLSFLPQSLSSLSQFEPKYIFNSVSRHLYLPSVGAALCYAVVLRDVLNRSGRMIGWGVVTVVLCGFIWLNNGWLTERGQAWESDGRPVQVFLEELKKQVSSFPPDTWFFSINGPTGRAYMQQSLRAFYHNPKITWIVDPTTFVPKPGQTALLIDVLWAGENRIYAIDILPFSLATLYQRMR